MFSDRAPRVRAPRELERTRAVHEVELQATVLGAGGILVPSGANDSAMWWNGRGFRTMRMVLLFALPAMACREEAPRPPVTEPPADVSSVGRAEGAGCEGCRVVLEEVATLGSPEPPGALSDQTWISASSHGRFYVHDGVTEPSRLMVFNPDGSYRTTIGRDGEGPGEYRFPLVVLSKSPDIIEVVDDQLRRLTTLKVADYEVMDVQTLPVVIDEYARLEDGRLVVNRIVRTTSAIGFPLHLLDHSFRIVRSFGTDEPMLDPTVPRSAYYHDRALAASDGDRFWAARPNEYTIELWDSSGELLRTLHRDVPWFQPWETGWAPWMAPPRPEVVGVREDDEGRLWVLLHVPDANWESRPAVPSRTVPGHERRMKADYHYFYDTVLEVIDPLSGELIASTRSELHLRGFLHGGLLYSAREDSVGNYFYDIVRPTLLSGA